MSDTFSLYSTLVWLQIRKLRVQITSRSPMSSSLTVSITVISDVKNLIFILQNHLFK